MEREFVSYEQAVALKELGFDEQVFQRFTLPNMDDFCKHPLKQQVFKFFMEKYNLRGFIGFRPNVKKFDYHIYNMSLSGEEYVKQRTMKEFNKDPKVGTYEEAENACISKLLELVKQQDKCHTE